jgi:hypothetical protein
MSQLSRKQKIDAIVELQKNLLAGTAIDSEFTLGKYQFLVNEGLLPKIISDNDMIIYRLVAEQEYEYELKEIVNTGTLIDARSAAELLIKLNTNRTNHYQEEYLSEKIKIIALKTFLIEKELHFENS